MEIVLALVIGAAAGVATGLLPGIHVNTLAAIAIALQPNWGLAGAVALLAVGTVHTIVNILPATYIGAPDEDDVVAALPAHRLLMEGRAAEAVSVSVAASMVGIATAVMLGAGLRGLLASHSFLAIVDWLSPFVLIAVLLALWLQEMRQGWSGPAKGAFVAAGAAVMGLLGASLPLRPLVPVPPSSLLPLLGGLFGAAGLSLAFERPAQAPWQPDSERVARRSGTAMAGSVAATVTALLPGLTSAVATAMLPGIRGRPLHAIASMSAINSAHAVFAMVVWMTTGRIRTGLADGVNHWTQAHWYGILPSDAGGILLATVLASAVIGAMATMCLDATIRRQESLPARALAAAGLAVLTVVVWLLSGVIGLLFYGACMAVGRLPLLLGVRRVHLVACLIVPAIIWQWS